MSSIWHFIYIVIEFLTCTYLAKITTSITCTKQNDNRTKLYNYYIYYQYDHEFDHDLDNLYCCTFRNIKFSRLDLYTCNEFLIYQNNVAQFFFNILDFKNKQYVNITSVFKKYILWGEKYYVLEISSDLIENFRNIYERLIQFNSSPILHLPKISCEINLFPTELQASQG